MNELFKNKVEKQKEKINKLHDRLKLEKDKLHALYELCTHEYGSYSYDYYYEPSGHEIGYTERRHYCNLCDLYIKSEDNYNSRNFAVSYDYFSEKKERNDE